MRIAAIALAAQTSLTMAPATTWGQSDQVWRGPEIKSVLVLGSVGSGQRSVVQANAIGAALVAGTLHAPGEGEAVDLPGGKSQQWQAIPVDAEGWIRNQGFARGGYAFVVVDSEVDQVVLLSARNSAFAIVNDEQRAGDPYGYGYVELPIHLVRGRNELLVRGGRGDSQLVFKQARQPAMLGGDMTLPDVLAGDAGPHLGSILVANTTTNWLRGASLRTRQTSSTNTSASIDTKIDPIPPLGVAKTPFSLKADEGTTASLAYEISLVTSGGDAADSKTVNIQVKTPTEQRTVTFRSAIDGSTQYYALRPAIPADGKTEGLPLILTVHGASVEAGGQAAAYSSKPWCNLVAATNRRPFGFDWEDWGRLDAIEVLDHASAHLKPDARRVYLTGHSMGGHGTWQLGAHFPGRFAAIAPSAGWISFWSYSGAAAYEGGTAVENILRRAASPSDTLALKANYLQHGVYILHGDADDNVPVEQARQMRKTLGEFHPDFAYYERPGAGHWWGNECVDWPPLMQFLQGHSRPAAATSVRFTTSSPGVSASCDWATVEAQIEQLKPSSIDLKLSVEPARDGGPDPQARFVSIKGTTTNVETLSLDVFQILLQVPVDPKAEIRGLNIQLDGQDPRQIDLAAAGSQLVLGHSDSAWSVGATPPATNKTPRRGGLFKTAFTNNVVLVIGTAGTAEENAWSLAKARLDAESFWYRGNGLLRIITDNEAVSSSEFADSNLILYGNADTNAAWKVLLSDSPVQVSRGGITVGDRRLEGIDLACLLLRPRAGDDAACVGAVTGTGMAGFRLAGQIPYFVSGVGIPDWIVIGPEAMKSGVRGVRGAGFFDNQWRLSEPDSGWAEQTTSP